MLLEGGGPVAGAILAAGASTRLRSPKQVATIDGEMLVRRATRALIESQCSFVAVVVGAYADDTAEAVAGLGASVLPNPGWREGIASSIRVATTWADGLEAQGLLIAVCDQPFLDSERVDTLLAAFRAEGHAVGSAYAETVGVPAVFGRSEFPALLQLRGDQGARGLLRGAPAVAWDAGTIDVDTQDDLDLARARFSRRAPA